MIPLIGRKKKKRKMVFNTEIRLTKQAYYKNYSFNDHFGSSKKEGVGNVIML